MNAVRLAIVLALTVAAAVAANVALLSLSSGSREPVGKLLPVASQAGTPTTPSTPVRSPSPPLSHGDEGEEDD